MSVYLEFIASKRIVAPTAGIASDVALSERMFPFQRDIVAWALRRGRAAIFADCGLGKSLMQIEWARVVNEATGRPVLILAPLAVATQTVGEGRKFGIDVVYARSQSQAGAGITVANYEMLEHFDASVFSGVVLDESSILKSYTGKFRNLVIESFAKTPYKLACTATPAPNDFMELGNHSEFLGALSRTEMLAMFFVHDGGETQAWRLKGHAESDFWRWVASWAAVVRKPSDLGYPDAGFNLPKLAIENVVVDVSTEQAPTGMLFAADAQTLSERQAARRDSTDRRVEICASLVNSKPGPWVVWCALNDESAKITAAIPGAVEVRGSDTREHKEAAMLGFASGQIRVLVSKVKICGFGMNWQHCSNVAFLGVSDSYEQFYQAVRRCWRFGQKSDVSVYVVTASTEGAVLRNIQRKEADAQTMNDAVAGFSRESIHDNTAEHKRTDYKTETRHGSGWEMRLGDCVETIRGIDDGSVDYTIFSPPFASLYTYTDSDRDMGNCRDEAEFAKHFAFLVGELFRVTAPGRLLSFHCMNLPTSKTRHGHIGISDFRGHLVRLFVQAGWIFHSEVCIWKDPVTAMQRTKAIGLLYKQLRKDSSLSRQGIPDYLVTMRKPGENAKRIAHTPEQFPVEFWQQYASPVWMDINPSRTLQRDSAREENDERHICPLQLDVIERALDLWSAPGDLVLSPFAGIGSEGFCSVRKGRRFVGLELKRSYFDQACANLKEASAKTSTQIQMFAESA